MGKRERMRSDVANFLEGVLSSRRVEEYDARPSLSSVMDAVDSQNSSEDGSERRSRSHSKNRSSPNTSGTGSLPLTTSSGGQNMSDSQKSAGSAFATKMDFFCREEEDLADMSLYLTRAAASARTPEALVALVNIFLTRGTETVLLSLKRSGMQPKFFGLLSSVSLAGLSQEYQQLFFRFLAFLVKRSDTELLCEEELMKFLLSFCQPHSTLTAEASPAETQKSSHWSQKTRRIATVSRHPLDTSELKVAVNALCGEEEPASCTCLTLRALLGVIFRQNGAMTTAHPPTDLSISLTFAKLGGLNIVSHLLDTEECADVLHLLEAVTLCEGLRGRYTSDLEITALCLVHFIMESEKRHCKDDILHSEKKNAALRVLTNVTKLVPSVFCESTHENKALATIAANILTDAEAASDTLAFTLCFATNIVKWEASSESRTEFTRQLVEHPSFLASVASLTFNLYHAEDAEKNVLAGYFALLLAVLSLCESPKLQLRVPVMTAVVQATRGTVALKKVEDKPMTLIVAILQEFLLFQSSARSLTRESLVSMSGIIDNVVKSNGIEVSSGEK